MENAIIIVALIAFAAFHQWMQHHRRILIHRERVKAIEKGVELPPLDQEVKRATWNVQRILLLLGFTWLSIGIGVFVTLSVVLAFGANENTKEIPQGMQYIGIVPFGIGLAHLITYLVGSRKQQ